jgi:hypothetical protein
MDCRCCGQAGTLQRASQQLLKRPKRQSIGFDRAKHFLKTGFQ